MVMMVMMVVVVVMVVWRFWSAGFGVHGICEGSIGLFIGRGIFGVHGGIWRLWAFFQEHGITEGEGESSEYLHLRRWRDGVLFWVSGGAQNGGRREGKGKGKRVISRSENVFVDRIRVALRLRLCLYLVLVK